MTQLWICLLINSATTMNRFQNRVSVAIRCTTITTIICTISESMPLDIHLILQVPHVSGSG